MRASLTAIAITSSSAVPPIMAICIAQELAGMARSMLRMLMDLYGALALFRPRLTSQLPYGKAVSLVTLGQEGTSVPT